MTRAKWADRSFNFFEHKSNLLFFVKKTGDSHEKTKNFCALLKIDSLVSLFKKERWKRIALIALYQKSKKSDSLVFVKKTSDLHEKTKSEFPTLQTGHLVGRNSPGHQMGRKDGWPGYRLILILMPTLTSIDRDFDPIIDIDWSWFWFWHFYSISWSWYGL